eukprot:2435956-Prymnesium_polylepis.1
MDDERRACQRVLQMHVGHRNSAGERTHIIGLASAQAISHRAAMPRCSVNAIIIHQNQKRSRGEWRFRIRL